MIELERTAASAAHLPPDVTEPDLLGDGTLVASWTRRWREQPSAPALWVGPTGWLTRGDLDGRSRRVAGRLHRAGLRAGDRLLLSAENSAELVVAHLAASRLGLVVVPVNTAYQRDEIAHVAADCRPRVAVVDDAARGAWVDEAVDDDVLVTTPAVALPDAEDDVVLDAADPADPALLVYTSGTTGAPKGALLTHANLLATAEALRLAWRWTPRDRLLLCLPLFHIHGLGNGLHGSLHAGASIVLLSRFAPDAVLQAAGEHEATMFFGVPTMYARLVDSPEAGELRRLRLCVSGSAPLQADLHRRVEDVSGQRVLERYGMTETGMLVSNPVDGERRPGAVGLPLPGVRVRLVDVEHCDGQATGAIEVRGPNVFAGYWQRPDADADAFTGDRWFRTGDIGALDDDGYLRIVGRAKDLVITGGFNVHPREVEDVLRTHPAVGDVAVIGQPDAEWGEVVVAVVVVAPGAAAPSVEELRAHFAGRLAPYKHPRRVRMVDELPRNALGKVQKHRLRDN